jgi:hypothetical protein
VCLGKISSGTFKRSRAQLFPEPLLSTRRRMRRRGRSRVLTSVRTAARNFDLLLAIATPSTSAPSFSRGWYDSDSVWRQQGRPFEAEYFGLGLSIAECAPWLRSRVHTTGAGLKPATFPRRVFFFVLPSAANC